MDIVGLVAVIVWVLLDPDLVDSSFETGVGVEIAAKQNHGCRRWEINLEGSCQISELVCEF